MSIVAQKKPPISETHPELAKQWSSKNVLGANEVTAGSGKKVWWVCSKGHEWEANPHNRVKGRGCPYCSGRKATAGYNDLAATHPHLIEEWSKKNSLPPSKVKAGMNRKVWWVCKKGHEWEASPNSRTRADKSSNCPYCSNKKVLKGFNDLATTDPELARQWSNKNKQQPEIVLAGSGKKVWWICDKGHEWETSPNSRSKGNGCPICAGRKVLIGFNDFATVNPSLTAQWSSKNTVRANEVTASSHKKVWWICDKGHEWEAAVYSRSEGRGCPVCSGRQVLVGYNDLSTAYPWIQPFYHKNNPPIDTITSGSNQRVILQCEKGHTWGSYAYALKKVTNLCPKCSLVGTSTPEQKVISSLTTLYETHQQHPIYYENNKRIIVDGLVISNGIKYVVEYDGEYWHTGLLLRDTYKTNILLNMGYRVIRIRENHKNTIEKININHPHFLQLDYQYTKEHSQLEDIITQIIEYIGVDTVPTIV